MIITTIAICGRFCSPEGVINGSCLNYGSFLAGLCPKSRAQRARAPRLPRFILLVGFGGMAYDSYLVAAFAVLGGLAGGGGYYWFLWGRGLSPGLGTRRVGALPSGVYPAGGLRWRGL